MHQITLVEPRCTACGICELICTFHHTGAFGRAVSSIRALKNAARGEVDLSISETGENGRIGCDGCGDEALPLCVRWCPVGAVQAKKEAAHV
jgi:Fe-S-cluster-containing hydrogenase component 2